MGYTVMIRNNATGQERRYACEWDWEDADEYGWTDGNFACDCNRELFWRRAAGEEDPDDTACGEERFAALYAEMPDGTRVTLDA